MGFFNKNGRPKEDAPIQLDMDAFVELEESFTSLSETLDSPELQAKLIDELSKAIEEDDRRIEVSNLEDGWVAIYWWPYFIRAELLISPLFATSEGKNYVKVIVSIPVGKAPDTETGQLYVYQHNLLAATTYQWVLHEEDEIVCRTIIIVDPEQEVSITAAKAIIWETCAAGLGKASGIIIDGTEEGYRPTELHKPSRVSTEELFEERSVLKENVRIREFGDNYKNYWEGTCPEWVGDWVTKIYSPVIGEIASKMPKGKFWTSFPILTLLSSAPEDNVNAFALLTVIPDEHPYIGKGIRVTLELDNIFSNTYEAMRACNLLNIKEYETSNMPLSSTGSWMVNPTIQVESGEKPKIVYTSFYASSHGSFIDIDNVSWQMISRAHRASSLLGPSSIDNSVITNLDHLETSLSMTENGIDDHLLVTVGAALDENTIYDSGLGWAYLRNVIQKRLSLDAEWCLDTPEHLWWWGTPFPVEIATEMIAPNENDGIVRRLVRVATRIAHVTDGNQIEEVQNKIMSWNMRRPGCTALLEDRDGVAELLLSQTIPFSENISHSARALTNTIALQSTYALNLFTTLDKEITLEPIVIEHPLEGTRNEIDPIAIMFHPLNPNPPHFDVVNYLETGVRESYEKIMRDTEHLDSGWSDTEAVYFQLKSDPLIAIGMGLLSSAESSFGSGVRYSVTIPLFLPINENINPADIANVLNHSLAHASEKGHYVSHIGSVLAAPTDRGVYQFALEAFIPADVLHEYNTCEVTIDQRAGVLAHWAFAILGQGIFLANIIDTKRNSAIFGSQSI